MGFLSNLLCCFHRPEQHARLQEQQGHHETMHRTLEQEKINALYKSHNLAPIPPFREKPLTILNTQV